MTFSSDVRTKPSSAVSAVAVRVPISLSRVVALAAKIKTLFGVDLMGIATVHGHISAISKPAGDPFARYIAVDGAVIENDVCPMCDAHVARAAAHDCTEIVLYTAAEAPNKDHATTFAPHGLTPVQLAAIAALRNQDI